MSSSRPSTPDVNLDALIDGDAVVPDVTTFTLGDPLVDEPRAAVPAEVPTAVHQTWEPIVLDTAPRTKRRRTALPPAAAPVVLPNPAVDVRRLQHELEDLRTRMTRIESMVEVFDEPEEEEESDERHSHSDTESESESDISSDDSEVLSVPEGYEYIYDQISDILVSGDDWLLHEPYVHEMAGNVAIAFYKADQQFKLRADKMPNAKEREDYRVAYDTERCENLQTVVTMCQNIKDSLQASTRCAQVVMSVPSHLEAKLAREKAAHVKSVNRSNRLRSWAVTGTLVCGFVVTSVWTYQNYLHEMIH